MSSRLTQGHEDTEGTKARGISYRNRKERILEAAKKVFEGNIRKGTIPEKWDGKAAERIVEILVNSQE